MAYQNGIATTPNQLLDALRTFAVANGWTESRWGAITTGYQLSLTKNGIHAHLHSATNESLRSSLETVTGLFLTGSTGFDAALDWKNQTGKPQKTDGSVLACGLFNVSDSNAYHLFAASNPDMIMLVVEVSPGVFHQLAFGALTQYAAATSGGGAFVTGSFGVDDYVYDYPGFTDMIMTYPYDRHVGFPFNDGKSGGSGAMVLVEVDAATRWFSVCKESPDTGIRCKALFESGVDGYGSLAYPWWKNIPNTINGVTPMIPFYLSVERPGGYFSPFGYAPHLRYLNMTHYQPGDRFTIGTDEWMVFPGHSRNTKSGVHGYAVRVNG